MVIRSGISSGLVIRNMEKRQEEFERVWLGRNNSSDVSKGCRKTAHLRGCLGPTNTQVLP